MTKIAKGKGYEKFVNEVRTIQKKNKQAKAKANKTGITPDDGYKVDYSKLKKKPKPKYK